MTKWIPVSERLPANGETVLWHDTKDDIWPTYVGKRDGNSIDHGGDLNQPLKTGPTHWMPLPPPPG